MQAICERGHLRQPERNAKAKHHKETRTSSTTAGRWSISAGRVNHNATPTKPPAAAAVNGIATPWMPASARSSLTGSVLRSRPRCKLGSQPSQRCRGDERDRAQCADHEPIQRLSGRGPQQPYHHCGKEPSGPQYPPG